MAELAKQIVEKDHRSAVEKGRAAALSVLTPNPRPSRDDEMGLCPSSDKETKKADGADSPAPEKLPKDQTNKWKDEKAHAGKFLQGFVGGSGSGQEFDTFSEALDELFCETGHIKGGITQGPNGKYTIRAGTDLRDSPKPEVEVSWLKVDLGNAGTKLETQHVLVGAPPVGPLPQTFRTFSEAVDFLFADSTAKLCAGAGGITQQPDGKYTIRTGTDLQASDGEVSWLKDDLRDLKDHLTKTNSSWYESDRGPWMAN